ncbi:MAG: hypothetical protein VB047_05510 [Anaerotignum propionicum]|uniref:hypothetical protein n=1 Tax=Anaerotignum propionicum TaxID=28446 RepID=UPI002B217658|nr:hypothetical protein [Anaerotignum propionicum]MEA5056999.1 hypothetical protein [Anaerotignum propionicum]
MYDFFRIICKNKSGKYITNLLFGGNLWEHYIVIDKTAFELARVNYFNYKLMMS